MVTVRKKRLRGRSYYYLQHSVRDGRRVEKKEKYLGKDLPEKPLTLIIKPIFWKYPAVGFKDFDNLPLYQLHIADAGKIQVFAQPRML
jgi:hypothetical protein